MGLKRFALIGLAIAAGAAVLVVAWSLYFRPIKVQIAAVQRDVPVDVFGLGTVEARVISRIGFKVAGVLVELRADVGDRIVKGAVLARLDDREQTARVGKVMAGVQQAEANLQRAIASLDRAKANHVNAKNINERRQKLVLSSSTSIESADTAKAAEDVAVAEVNLASSDIQVARAAINDAKASEQQERATLDFSTLMAPYDAAVIARTKELGAALGAGEPVFTIIDPKTVWVLAYIDESKAGEIRLGARAQIILRSLPGKPFEGRVARIEIESDRVNEERRVQIAFENIPADFHLGEQAEVHITTTVLPRAVLVPEAAVLSLEAGRGKVWVATDHRLNQREVTFGHRLLDGRLEITDVMPEGVFVVDKLRSGMRIGRAVTIAEDRKK